MPKSCTPPEIFAPPLGSNRKSTLAQRVSALRDMSLSDGVFKSKIAILKTIFLKNDRSLVPVSQGTGSPIFHTRGATDNWTP